MRKFVVIMFYSFVKITIAITRYSGEIFQFFGLNKISVILSHGNVFVILTAKSESYYLIREGSDQLDNSSFVDYTPLQTYK